MTGLLPALAGANVVYGCGMLEMVITFDLAQLVLDNELARMIQHTLQGVAVNDITLAVDIIKEMGIGKDYLAHESTYEYMRTQSQAQLIDRQMRPNWQADGGKDMFERSHAKMLEILKTHTPVPLPESVRQELRSIVADAEKELKV
ncbi:MAG: trimethylamine methyltransferase family protein [Desulfohalobiaceae bacterium]|nr:trimethylamine methyltransferase family protein [Desulfohalobiaceae bacterium]